MTNNLHFGFKPNKHVCSCGKHYGYGALTAEERYERARSFREKLPKLMTSSMKAYLQSWEYHHNPETVTPTIQRYQPYAD